MKKEHLYKEIENSVRELGIMENHHKISIPLNQPIFTSSQEMDVKELINDGLNKEEIITIIKQW